MKKLNLGKSIIQKRKEKGITQEKLAEYMGVSKAAVSKWESGQSYPDILCYPNWPPILIFQWMNSWDIRHR
jgi:DNA-binding XRE family transcriptional regulator